MSEENEHEHGHEHGFGFLLGPTRDQIEQQQMQAESNGHEMRQFFHSLNESQLSVLINVLANTIYSDGMAGSYYQGIAQVLLEEKFGLCLACGKKHDDELKELINTPETETDVDRLRSMLAEPPLIATFPSKGSFEYLRLMAEYHMEKDDNGSDRVMCTNCKKWYENLQDRTLRSPDKTGCSGCIHKEKHG